MDPVWKEKWIRALRSGDYDQGKGTLISGADAPRPLFCCLGVLCDLVQPDRSSWENGGVLPPAIMFEVGLTWDNPRTDVPLDEELITPNSARPAALSTLNDRMGFDFNQIADVIERCF